MLIQVPLLKHTQVFSSHNGDGLSTKWRFRNILILHSHFPRIELKSTQNTMWLPWYFYVGWFNGCTLLMWTCCWYCFCFSKKFWCCCWITSWASVLWGSGADWVRFRGRWRGSLGRVLPGELSLMASGEGGCKWLWPMWVKWILFIQCKTSNNLPLMSWTVIHCKKTSSIFWQPGHLKNTVKYFFSV